MIIVIILYLALIALMIVSMWRIFEKAGKPGWASIIPIYNIIVMLEIAQKPWWWLLLMLIPYVGLIWSIWMLNMVVKKFGKEEGFTIGCIFLPFVFFPILAFGDAQYQGVDPVVGKGEVLDANLV